MNLNDVLSKVKKRPTRKRCGRGRGSGLGKTSGRGHKGAASRSGWRRRYGYDGGQTSLIRRLPKRGFTPLNRIEYQVVNLDQLKDFAAGSVVTVEALIAAGKVRKNAGPIKVLGRGKLEKKLSLRINKVSAAARTAVEAAGGTVEEI